MLQAFNEDGIDAFVLIECPRVPKIFTPQMVCPSKMLKGL